MARARHSLRGQALREVLDDLSRTYIDVEVEVEFKRGPYNGTRSLGSKRFRFRRRRPQRGRRRLPSVRDKSVEEEFFPADLAQIYRCRWEVELLFRELKTQYDLDEFDTSTGPVGSSVSALLSLLMSRELLELVTEQAGDERRVSAVRAGFSSTSGARPCSSSTNSAYLGYSPPPLLGTDDRRTHRRFTSNDRYYKETLATATQPRTGLPAKDE